MCEVDDCGRNIACLVEWFRRTRHTSAMGDLGNERYLSARGEYRCGDPWPNHHPVPFMLGANRSFDLLDQDHFHSHTKDRLRLIHRCGCCLGDNNKTASKFASSFNGVRVRTSNTSQQTTGWEVVVHLFALKTVFETIRFRSEWQNSTPNSFCLIGHNRWCGNILCNFFCRFFNSICCFFVVDKLITGFHTAIKSSSQAFAHIRAQ